MKNNKNKNDKTTKQQPQQPGRSGGPAITPDEWWAGLSPADKQFSYEIGLLMQAFKGGLMGNVLSTPGGVERAMEALYKQLDIVTEKNTADWPKNPGEARRLN